MKPNSLLMAVVGLLSLAGAGRTVGSKGVGSKGVGSYY